MQVTCFGMDWKEINARPSSEAVVDELILSDDFDDYAVNPPQNIWLSDSARQYLEAAEEIETLKVHSSGELGQHLFSVNQVISSEGALDELAICNLTDGCYFISIPPEKLREIHGDFVQFCRTDEFNSLKSDTKNCVNQWKAAIEFFNEKNLGMIGHMG